MQEACSRQGQVQHTLKNAIHCAGVGLHSGVRIKMTLHPAEPDTGIVFRRIDSEGTGQEVVATWRNAVETPLCTTLLDSGLRIATIEHLLSALAGCGIDNVVVELDGPEVPIMDGSAAPFVFLIDCAGKADQGVPRRMIRLHKTVSLVEDGRCASIEPADRFSIDMEIDFNCPAVGRQSWAVEVTDDSYRQEVSRARTFGFLGDIDMLRERGLAQGGSLDNAVVFDGRRVVNEGGLRYPDEPVRHKVLDTIGDLYLAGAPILGHFTGRCTGHALNLRLLQALFADDSVWDWFEPDIEERLEPRGASANLIHAVAAPA